MKEKLFKILLIPILVLAVGFGVYALWTDRMEIDAKLAISYPVEVVVLETEEEIPKKEYPDGEGNLRVEEAGAEAYRAPDSEVPVQESTYVPAGDESKGEPLENSSPAPEEEVRPADSQQEEASRPADPQQPEAAEPADSQQDEPVPGGQ